MLFSHSPSSIIPWDPDMPSSPYILFTPPPFFPVVFHLYPHCECHNSCVLGSLEIGHMLNHVFLLKVTCIHARARTLCFYSLVELKIRPVLSNQHSSPPQWYWGAQRWGGQWCALSDSVSHSSRKEHEDYRKGKILLGTAFYSQFVFICPSAPLGCLWERVSTCFIGRYCVSGSKSVFTHRCEWRTSVSVPLLFVSGWNYLGVNRFASTLLC